MNHSKLAPDAPTYNATLEEMEDLSQLISNASALALQYGAVRIDPPQGWISPPLRMRPDSRFFVRMQTLPAAPFVDISPPTESHPVQTNHAPLPESQPLPAAAACGASSNRRRTPSNGRRKVRRHIVTDDEDESDDAINGSKSARPNGDSNKPALQMTTQGPFLNLGVSPSPTQPTSETPHDTLPSAVDPSKVAISVEKPAPCKYQQIAAPKPSQARATQQALETEPNGPTSRNPNLHTDGHISPAVPRNRGPSQAEMMMSTAAAARQALSPFTRVEGPRRAPREALSGLELGDTLATSVEKERPSVPPLRSVPADVAKKAAPSAGVPADSVSIPLSQRAIASGMPVGDGRRHLGRNKAIGASRSRQGSDAAKESSFPNMKKPLDVARVQAGKKATSPTGTTRFKIPRSVPLPLPECPNGPALRSVPVHGAINARGLTERKDANRLVRDRAGSDRYENLQDCSKLIDPTTAGTAQLLKRSPSRPSMDIDLLLNPADEPLSEKSDLSMVNEGSDAMPARTSMIATAGATESKAAGGGLNALLNYGMQHPGKQSASSSRLVARRNAMEMVDDLLRKVDKITAARSHSKRVSRVVHMKESHRTRTDTRNGSAGSQRISPGCNKTRATSATWMSISPMDIDTQITRSENDAAQNNHATEDADTVARKSMVVVPSSGTIENVARVSPSSVSAMPHSHRKQSAEEARKPAPNASELDTVYGVGQQPSVTEPQALAAVLTHDPDISMADQEPKLQSPLVAGSKQPRSPKTGQYESSLNGASSSTAHFTSEPRNQLGTNRPVNGNSAQLQLRLKLKIRDTRPPSTAQIRKEPSTEEIEPEISGIARTPISERDLDQSRQGLNVAGDVDAQVGQKRQKTARSLQSKRKANYICDLKWDQDKAGRLTKPIVFPDSQTPVTLRNYRRKATSFEEKLWRILLGDKTFDVKVLKKMTAGNNDDWMRSPDVLEQVFWLVIEKGLEGQPVVVPYGVDVEVEGAFDSMGMSYVEWYGDSDKDGGRSRRKKAAARKAKTCKPPQTNTHSAKEEEIKAVEDVGSASAAGDAAKAPGTWKPLHSSMVLGKAQKKQFLPIGPKSHVGNLNTKGILRHMPRMPGINHSMYYVGQMLSRFCWHVEDAFLNSVSYLHPGSAPKIWYAVPPSYANKFEDYATNNVFSDELLDEVGSGQFLLANKTTMFNPRKLAAAGVKVFRVVHNPGSFVLTAPRAYHAGFNCGYNVAEAVNYANPAWLPVGRQAARFARAMRKVLCVPYEYLLFHEAKATRDLTLGERHAPKAKGLQEDAKILAEELYQVVSQGESQIRAYAEKSNCRVATLHEVTALGRNSQLGPEYGHGAGHICSVCGHVCHFYAEICASCDDSFEARCVEHFGQGHRLCHHKDHSTILVRRHDPVLLADILTTLEKMSGIERPHSELLQRYSGYLRTWETPLRRSGLRLKLNFTQAASRLPPVMAEKPKQSKEGAQRETGRKGKRRSEVESREDAGSDDNGDSKVKRRRVAKRKVEATKKPIAEPVVVPAVVPKLEAVCDVPDGSSSSPSGNCHIFPGMDRMALKASYRERKRASLRAVKEESDDGSEYFVVPKERRS